MHEVTNSDYEGEIKNQGDKVEVRVAPPTLASQSYVAGGTVVYTQSSEAARFLSIDQGLVVAFEFDVIEKVQSDIDIFNMYADRAAYTMTRDISIDVLAVMALGAYDGTDWTGSSGNQGSTAGKLTKNTNLGVYVAAANVGNVPIAIDATNALDYIVDVGTVLDEADVPPENRFIVLPAWFCGMLKKSDLKAADVTGDNTGVIRTGLIGEVNNFKVYQNNLLHTSTDDGTASLTGFHCVAGVTDATTFASQVTKTETVIAEATFGEKWRTLAVYGRKVIQPEALAMLYCYKA